MATQVMPCTQPAAAGATTVMGTTLHKERARAQRKGPRLPWVQQWAGQDGRHSLHSNLRGECPQKGPGQRGSERYPLRAGPCSPGRCHFLSEEATAQQLEALRINAASGGESPSAGASAIPSAEEARPSWDGGEGVLIQRTVETNELAGRGFIQMEPEADWGVSVKKDT